MPHVLATRLSGNDRIWEFSEPTAPLYRNRSTAIRFSVPASSNIRLLTRSIDRRYGYASYVATRRKSCWSMTIELFTRLSNEKFCCHWVRRRVMFSSTDSSNSVYCEVMLTRRGIRSIFLWYSFSTCAHWVRTAWSLLTRPLYATAVHDTHTSRLIMNSA